MNKLSVFIRLSVFKLIMLLFVGLLGLAQVAFADIEQKGPSSINELLTLIEKDIYSDEEVVAKRMLLDQMVDDIQRGFTPEMTPTQKLEWIREYLYEWHGFQFDREDKEGLNPDNFYLSGVLSRRKGICTGLSFLYLSLAEKLELPLYGVMVPGHFFVRYEAADFSENVETTQGGIKRLDRYWIRKKSIHREAIESGVYLRSLRKEEVISYILAQHSIHLTELGEVEQAEHWVDQALSWDAFQVKALYVKGFLMLRRGAPTWQALHYLDRAVELDPKNAPALSYRSLAHAQLGHFENAVRDGIRACGLNPKNSFYYQNLAAVYTLQGNEHRASLTMKKAKQLSI